MQIKLGFSEGARKLNRYCWMQSCHSKKAVYTNMYNLNHSIFGGRHARIPYSRSRSTVLRTSC